MPDFEPSASSPPKSSLTVVFVAAPEVFFDVSTPVFGQSVLQRNLQHARAANIAELYALPGIRSEPAGLPLVSVGELLLGPVLIVLEGSSLTEAFFRFLSELVEHPDYEGRGQTIYDRAGRPSAYLAADLTRIPARMPIAEGITLPRPRSSAGHEPPLPDLPPELGSWWDGSPADDASEGALDRGDAIVRFVQAEDRRRVESQLMAQVGLSPQRPWHRWGTRYVLVAMSQIPLTLAQWEFVALILGMGGAAWVATDGYLPLVLGTLAWFCSVEIALLLPRWARLTPAVLSPDWPADRPSDRPPNRPSDRPSDWPRPAAAERASEEPRAGEPKSRWLDPGVVVAEAIRPLAHAVMILALGYAWVVESGQRLQLAQLSVAETGVLVVSGAGAVVCLAHARSIFRGGGWGHDLEVAHLDRVLSRIAGPTTLRRGEMALLEGMLFLLALGAQVFTMWWVLAIVTASRLWRFALRPV